MDRRRSSSLSVGGGTAKGSSAAATSHATGGGGTDQAAAAAASLQLLLREDPLLMKHGLTESKNPDQVAFPYAAALLQEEEVVGAGGGGNNNTSSTTTTTSSISNAKQRADLALQDVERKLALVESLAVKLSRTSPEAVAGHLLRLHGYQVTTEAAIGTQDQQAVDAEASIAAAAAAGTTLHAVRERADRLERQSEVLENVAKRVEGSLQKGLDRMNMACTKLERVLSLSSTLKMILRAQFENSKLQSMDLDDLRDLTRAAASVAILEDLFRQPAMQQQQQSAKNNGSNKIGMVEQLRPQATQTAAAVRRAAAALLEQHYQEPTSVPQLGATLQVYFHLHELPSAVYKVLEMCTVQAVTASQQLWNGTTLTNLSEQARKQAKDSRMVTKKLVQLRLEAAETWANTVTQVTTSVRNLERILTRKTDPESRQVFIEVVAKATIPAAYQHGRTSKSHGHSKKHNQQQRQQQHKNKKFSLFALFWERFCRELGDILHTVLETENGKYVSDVAALYPPVRSVAKNLVGQLQESLPLVAAHEDSASSSSATPSAGILGGSAALDQALVHWSSGGGVFGGALTTATTMLDNPQSADSWTQTGQAAAASSSLYAAAAAARVGANSSAMNLVIFQSSEWKTLVSNSEEAAGIYPLQQAFVEACTERLCQPLQYMFSDSVALNDDGVPISSGLALLPSKYDVQRFDENIRQELALADPKEGGGELTAVTMIAECVVGMISQFCARARNAMSGASDYLKDDWSMTEALQHDRKVAAIMYTLQTYLKSGPEKTFIAPYRPATSPQHEEAVELCLASLQPALDNIDSVVTGVILEPLCRAANRRLADIMAKMHLGVYMESGPIGMQDDDAGAASSFVQNQLAPVYEVIATNILTKFPPPYASIVAANIASFSIYAFVSNAALVRPLGESARLHLTQDLADLELSLEQLTLMKGGSSTQHLSQINNGRPYAELRAVRQMLFWNGMESKNKSGSDLAKALLREAWIRDVRPSTIIHYLFSYAPSLLSSPHHVKRVKAEEYVENLVKLDGSVDDGEEDAWMVTMSCCDSYAQRATSAGAPQDGDARVAQVLMSLGPELLRRRRH